MCYDCIRNTRGGARVMGAVATRREGPGRSAAVAAGGAWRWARQRRAALPLAGPGLAVGLGLYWAATQAGVLAVGWRPALATTALYLAAVAALAGGLTGSAVLGQRLVDRLLPAPGRAAPTPGSSAGSGGSRPLQLR